MGSPGQNDQLLVSEGAPELVKKLQTSENSWSGTKDLEGAKVIGYGNPCGFGVRTVITVGYGNIFSILKPTLFIVLVGLVVVLGIAFLVSYAISYRFTKPVTRMIQKHTGLWKTGSECQNGRFFYSGVS